MTSAKNVLSGIAGNIMAAAVMLIVSILGLFITIFIVQSAAGLAGYQPSGNYIILSATLLTGFAVISGMWKGE